jgi:hypothetical protein
LLMRRCAPSLQRQRWELPRPKPREGDTHDRRSRHFIYSQRPCNGLAQSVCKFMPSTHFLTHASGSSDANGWGLVSNAAHPGSARTELIANGPREKKFLWRLALLLAPLLSQSAADGALPALFAATSPDAAAAAYYGPCGFYEMKGAPSSAKILSQGDDTGLSTRLWDQSNDLVGVRWE